MEVALSAAVGVAGADGTGVTTVADRDFGYDNRRI